ncbi:hypothetical protein F5B18DRAFT_600392 [Nemania serpens]|nr:hypothetical protein F5B18DRAFT_600392 [Nemania serpens]
MQKPRRYMSVISAAVSAHPANSVNWGSHCASCRDNVKPTTSSFPLMISLQGAAFLNHRRWHGATMRH